MKGNPLTGAWFVVRGAMRMGEPGLRRFVALPLLFNAVLMIVATWWLTHIVAAQIPTWLQWLYWAIVPIAFILLTLTFAYFFSTVLMVLSSPFNGFLSEQVERKSGTDFPAETLTALVVRTSKRELIKLRYLLPRYLLLLILSCIPVVNLITPLLWFVFGSWVLALQYTDYSFDNHQHSFNDTKQVLRENVFTALGFGALVSLLMAIPLLNWFVMPAAVIGATMMRQQCFPLLERSSKSC